MHKQVRVPVYDLELSKLPLDPFSIFLLLRCRPVHVFVFSGDDPEYLITGTHAYPSGPGKYANTLANGL